MKKPSLAATLVKVFVGLLFSIMALDMDDDTIAVCLVLGLAFLAWAILPYRRYLQEKQDAQEGRLNNEKKPGIGAMIAKATFAALFIIMAFDMDDFSSLLVSLLLGAVFIIWAVYPFYKYRQHVQETDDDAVFSPHISDKPPISNRKRICPHCGAPMAGNICEYCGMYSESENDPE